MFRCTFYALFVCVALEDLGRQAKP